MSAHDNPRYVTPGNKVTDPDGYTGKVVAVETCYLIEYPGELAGMRTRYERWPVEVVKPVQPTDSGGAP